MERAKDWNDVVMNGNGHAIIETTDRAWTRGIELPEKLKREGGTVWPQLSPEASRGLAGEFASLATTHSEADPVAILLTTLTAVGALMPRGRNSRQARRRG
jgi:hypothetical protein